MSGHDDVEHRPSVIDGLPPSRVIVPTDGRVAVNLIAELGVSLNANGLTFTEGAAVPTLETWETIGRAIWMVGEAWQWWVADWINWGESIPGLFGDDGEELRPGDLAQHAGNPTTSDRYDVAHRITGAEPQTLMNISNIGRRIARSRRRTPPLGFWIHQEVAALEPDEQDAWLAEAVEAGLTKSQLRAAIKSGEGPGNAAGRDYDPPGPGPGPGRMTREEQMEAAAMLVINQAQPAADDLNELVPREAMEQLRVAFRRD